MSNVYQKFTPTPFSTTHLIYGTGLNYANENSNKYLTFIGGSPRFKLPENF